MVMKSQHFSEIPTRIDFLYKGSLADLKNIGGKGGGSITAALFLQEFVENAKWAHIDMAGMLFKRDILLCPVIVGRELSIHHTASIVNYHSK